MVCTYCGNKTQVINSRPQKRLRQTWRRRRCTACQAIFTTLEATDMATSVSVRAADGSLRPFSRDKLFMSILEAVGHRKTALDDAGALTATVIAQLFAKVSEALVEPDVIASVTRGVLRRFDTAAAVHYIAYHQG